jgi:hypothetical protein
MTANQKYCNGRALMIAGALGVAFFLGYLFGVSTVVLV